MPRLMSNGRPVPDYRNTFPEINREVEIRNATRNEPVQMSNEETKRVVNPSAKLPDPTTAKSYEEFERMKQNEARLRAAEHSMNRKEGSPLPERFNHNKEHVEIELEYLRRRTFSVISLRDMKERLEYAKKEELMGYSKEFPGDMKGLMELNIRQSQTDIGKKAYDLLVDKYNYEKEFFIHKNYNNNCIATASCNYMDNGYLAGLKEPFVSNNELRKNPVRYGFMEIRQEKSLAGDIINNTGHAATLHDDYRKDERRAVGYASGSGQLEYRQSFDTAFGFDKTFRYVGTEEDKKKWREEYNRIAEQRNNQNQ